MEAIFEKILSGATVEFSYRGKSYLIQEENNKGWDYLSLWRTAPDYSCMCRAFFDVPDGVSRETIRELFDQPFSEKYTVGEIIESPETVFQ